VASNLKNVLEEGAALAEKGTNLDNVEADALEALLDVAQTVPARKMLIEASGLGSSVFRYVTIFDKQFEAKASSIKASWATQRRYHSQDWLSPFEVALDADI
jgi:hypothetical protein